MGRELPLLLQAALIAACRDDWDLAEEHLAAVRDQSISFAVPRSGASWLLRAQALAAERAGRPDEAVTILAQCLDPEFAAAIPYRGMLLPALARVALAVGDPVLAAAAARAAAAQKKCLADRNPRARPAVLSFSAAMWLEVRLCPSR